jgi:CTP synthase (UTP-ammonia lyase)
MGGRTVRAAVPRSIRIGIVGERNDANPTHVGTDAAIRHAAADLGVDAAIEWIPTPELASANEDTVSRFDAALISPGSPYQSMEGALRAIRIARASDLPLLGTCAGFQHMIIEFARSDLGIADADHAETNPGAHHLFVTPLACSLVGRKERIRLVPGTQAARLFGRRESLEPFYCNFGLNPAHRADVERAGFVTEAVDDAGEVRIMRLARSRFAFGTLFVPQMASIPGHPHPLVRAFLAAAAE